MCQIGEVLPTFPLMMKLLASGSIVSGTIGEGAGFP